MAVAFAPQPPSRPDGYGTFVAVASLALYYPGSVLLARPLEELSDYVKNVELPPLELIARVIKTLALAIFRWHLCDQVLIAKKKGVFHSLEGRLEVASLDQLNKNYPKMFRNCFVLMYNDQAKVDLTKPRQHPHKDTYLGGHVFGRDAKLFPYKEITPQTITDYYRNFFGIELTDKRSGTTISDLFSSQYLKHETDNSVIEERFRSFYDLDIQGYRS
jgi:hypothetical protein